MNVFSNTEYQGIKISFENEIRSAVFSRLNVCFNKLGEEDKEKILSDGITEEFIERFSPQDELEKEYSNLLPRDEFIRLFNKAIDIYVGR